MRLPALQALAGTKAWWNPLWIEEFDLLTANRPAVCEGLLDERLPSVSVLALASGRDTAAGYVWSGGFTVYRLTPWSNGFRAMGTGTMQSGGPVTRIRLRIAVGRWTAYALALFYLVWAIGGVLAIVGTVVTFSEGHFNGVLPLLALGLLFGPLVIFALIAGRGEAKASRSRESDFILAFLRDTIGAEVAAA
jgi:hypothetical protein